MSNGTSTKKSSSSFHFLAGLSSGILSAVLLQPADLLKTRLQQGNHNTLLHTIRQIAFTPSSSFPSSSTNTLSLLSFWRGTLPSALRTGFGSAIYFTTLNALRQNVARSNLLRPIVLPTTDSNKDNATVKTGGEGTIKAGKPHSSTLPRLSNLANLTTGALARTFAGLLLMPMTVIKVRYESSLYAYTSISQASKAIYSTEGLKGFFSGFGATAIRDAPYAGLYVLFYEQSKKQLSALNQKVPLPLPELPLKPTTSKTPQSQSQMGTGTSASINFLSGILAAALATAITNPFDAIKTRIQLQPGKYGNIVKAGSRMVREDGWKCLFDGLGLRMGRKAVSSALAWTVYEELIRRAEGRWVVGGGGKEVVV